MEAEFNPKPHCWGKMTWILKYPSGMEPKHSVCRCEHGAVKCKLLTRQNNKKMEKPKPVKHEVIIIHEAHPTPTPEQIQALKEFWNNNAK